MVKKKVYLTPFLEVVRVDKFCWYSSEIFVVFCVRCCTALKIWRSRVRFTIVLLEFLIYTILLAALWLLGSTQPLKEMGTRSISWWVKAASAYGLQPDYLHEPIVMISGNLSLLEHSGFV